MTKPIEEIANLKWQTSVEDTKEADGTTQRPARKIQRKAMIYGEKQQQMTRSQQQMTRSQQQTTRSQQQMTRSQQQMTTTQQQDYCVRYLELERLMFLAYTL